MLEPVPLALDEYPTSDGEPLGETDVHRNQILDLIHGLEMHYLDRSDVYVSGNLLMFYQEGNPRRHVSPDVLVALDRPKHERDHYMVWLEGKAPDFIIEVTSKSTRSEDLGTKKGLYALLGVREYYIFDPLREYLKPNLRAYRLEGEDYTPVLGESVRSHVLGLELRIVDGRLRLLDLATGSLLNTRLETELARRQSQQALEQSQQALEQSQQALEQSQQALEQSQQALEHTQGTLGQTQGMLEQERKSREAAEDEAERLRRELARLQGS